MLDLLFVPLTYPSRRTTAAKFPKPLVVHSSTWPEARKSSAQMHGDQAVFIVTAILYDPAGFGNLLTIRASAQGWYCLILIETAFRIAMHMTPG